MRLPIDTTSLTFMCAAPARPVTDFETKQHKADTTTGELLYNLQVVALDDWGAEVIQVKVAGDPKVGQGAMLKLHGLVATPWSMTDRSGVSFRVDRVEAQGVAPGAQRRARAGEGGGVAAERCGGGRQWCGSSTSMHGRVGARGRGAISKSSRSECCGRCSAGESSSWARGDLGRRAAARGLAR